MRGVRWFESASIFLFVAMMLSFSFYPTHAFSEALSRTMTSGACSFTSFWAIARFSWCHAGPTIYVPSSYNRKQFIIFD